MVFFSKATVPLGQMFSPILHDRDKFSNCEQYETFRNDENGMCDYLSEYLRMCFRLYEDYIFVTIISEHFTDILRNEARNLRINKTK